MPSHSLMRLIVFKIAIFMSTQNRIDAAVIILNQTSQLTPAHIPTQKSDG